MTIGTNGSRKSGTSVVKRIVVFEYVWRGRSRCTPIAGEMDMVR
jgi:hypothetical protein